MLKDGKGSQAHHSGGWLPRPHQSEELSEPVQRPGSTASQGLSQAGGRSGEDYPPSLAPNLVQEKLEGIALSLNSSMYSNIVAA